MRQLLRHRLRDERGIALIVVLGVMMIFTISVTATVTYTTAGDRASGTSRAHVTARALAEAGLNNALAVISKPENNAMQQSTLPSSEATATSVSYEGGTAKWWGVLSGTNWTIYGVGLASNPTGPGTNPLRRQLSASVNVQSSLTQPLNAQAWNYVYAKNTGSQCDITLKNSMTIDASFFVAGNLCLENSSSVVKAAAPDVTNLIVKGNLDLVHSQNTVGTSANRINEMHLGGSCRYSGGAWKTAPCTSSQNVWATTYYGPTTPTVNAPNADWDYWFANAKPGPKNYCTTASGFSTSNFDNQSVATATRNNSAAEFNLTPGSNYTCEFWEGGTLRGRLNWVNSTKTLTVAGAIFFDGSVKISNGAVNNYNGQATIYLSGKLTIEGNTQLCGGISGGNCDFTNWNPNTEMLTFVANASGDSVVLQNSARFQGGIYGTGTVHIQNSAQVDGPMIGGTFILENSVQVHEFPNITSVPTGMPGNPNVYAQPQPATGYGG
jgi:Tfp pilus assembly protein PilX